MHLYNLDPSIMVFILTFIKKKTRFRFSSFHLHLFAKLYLLKTNVNTTYFCKTVLTKNKCKYDVLL